MDYSMPLERREVWFSANISPLSADSVVLVCRDVTERKRNELLLQDSLRQQELLRAHEAALLAALDPADPDQRPGRRHAAGRPARPGPRRARAPDPARGRAAGPRGRS